MMTIFEFGDCASASVASMPRQRRYESEIPWLTVCWNAAMPLASICLRLDSFGFALDAEFDIPGSVELFGLPVDGGDDRRRQFDAEHERIEDLDRVLQEVVVVLGVRLLHGLGLHQLVEIGAQALLRAVADLVLDGSREV